MKTIEDEELKRFLTEPPENINSISIHSEIGGIKEVRLQYIDGTFEDLEIKNQSQPIK